jgi:hypothetical protein
VQILSYGLHHIDTLISDESHHAAWRGSFIYGEPRTHDRSQMWELMKRLKSCQYAPWLIKRDFEGLEKATRGGEWEPIKIP